MDLQDTPQEAAFRQECREWIAANAPHHLKEQLEASVFGRSGLPADQAVPLAKEWQAKKAAAGWACLTWPKEYGGRGATPMESVIWNQEEGLFRRLSSLFVIGHGMCGPTLLEYANDEQKRRYLPPMASGEEIWCQLFSEPGAGSDLAGLRTRSERDGDDWIVNGQKVWTSGAHYSDYGILVTRSDPTLPKHKGMTYFFVDMRSPGIDIRPIKQASGASGFNEVFFTNVRIPDSNRLGQEGDGWSVAITTLMNERLAIGGSMSTGFEELMDLLHLVQLDSGPALEDPGIRDRVADWYTRAMGLRFTGYRALTALSQGKVPGPENSIGKVVAGNTMQEIAGAALEVQESAGILAQDDAADAKFPAMLMRSLGTRIEGGSDEILKNIIAERVLGLPGDIRLDRDVPYKDIPRGTA